MNGFKPHGDYVVIEASAKKDQTPSGIYIKPKDNPHYGKGQVVSIGAGILDEKGKIFPAEFKEGDYIVYDKRQGVEVVMGYALVKVQSIVAIVDKDTEISA
jgi:chaperonin GroES